MQHVFGSAVSPLMRSLAACLLLASCGENGLLPAGTQPNRPDPIVIQRTDASVFQKSDKALWDGRPSLGGVWVAHADVTSPEQVEIRNGETGRVIQAALFRRERDFPGPAFELSSDAAVALNIPAGTPTDITVTALRREPVALPADEPVEPDTVIAEDPALVAADAAVDEALAPDEALAVDEPKSAGSAGSFVFGAKPQNTGLNAPDAELAPVDDTLLSPAASDQAALNAMESQAPAELDAEPAPKPKAGSAGSMPGNKPTLVDDSGEPIPLEGSSLEPITATEILAVPLPEPETEAAIEPTSETAPEPEAALESATLTEPTAPVTSDLERPYVQVASGSNKDNVDALAAKLVAAGLPAAVRETTDQGKPLFYVVVGPASSQAELDATLARVRELGYPEAFIAKG